MANLIFAQSFFAVPRESRRRAAEQAFVVLTLLLGDASSLRAAQCSVTPSAWWLPLPGNSLATNNCFGGTGFRCYKGEDQGRFFRLKNPACDPNDPDGFPSGCTVQVGVSIEYPGVKQMFMEDGSSAPLPLVVWFEGDSAPACPNPVPPSNCGQLAFCGLPAFGGIINADLIDTYIEVAGVQCSTLAEREEVFSIRSISCRSACRMDATFEGLALASPAAAAALGCSIAPTPPPCKSCLSCPVASGSPPGRSSGDGKGGGNGAGTDIGSGVNSYVPEGSGPGVTLRYLAKGVGYPGFPGSAGWNAVLGRYWSHEGMERIAEDPDDSHVWLLTREGGFIEYTDTESGDPDSLYEMVAPSDEKDAKLYRTMGGWERRFLNGTVQTFRADGLWVSTVDRSGNVILASYTGTTLDAISLPDGRRDVFTYYAHGKLETVSLEGIDGTSTRTWTYHWTGDDLTRIDRPDDRSWELRYDDTENPGHLTRVTLRGNDGIDSRIERGFAYNDLGRVTHSWRGAEVATSIHATEVWLYSYDDPGPGQTTVTDPLGNDSIYTFDTDPASMRTRVASVSGSCPVCGTGPNSQFFYTDPENPLLVTRRIDGRGDETQFTYNENGLRTSRLDAATDATLMRLTEWFYEDTSFPSFPTRIEQPSVSSGLRTTALTYSTTGDLTDREISGVERQLMGGSTMPTAFAYTTSMMHNGAGETLSVDPPGHDIDDVTSWTYDPARGDLVPGARTDPLIGTTTFQHDAYNRRTHATDPNGVTTRTEYDDLDRVRFVTQEGATPTEDLVTEHTYTPLGDLFRTILPEGNVIEYGYDSVGRLESIERKPDETTPGERTLYTLDDFGNRVREEQQSWAAESSLWVTEAETMFVYTTRCHLDRIEYPDGSAIDYDYDCDGNLERVWDENNDPMNPATVVYSYDGLDRLITVTQPWAGAGGGSSITTYGYDVQDHLTSVTDAEGNGTTYEYSDRDLLTQEISLVSGTTTSLYNEHGELTWQSDARDITVLRTVDELDRLQAVDYPTEDDLDTAYTYDDGAFGLGRLSSIARGASIVSYGYDRFGRLTMDGALMYRYDGNSNRTEISYPGSITAAYTYDYADRPETLVVTLPDASEQTVVSTAAYKPSGPLSDLTLGNGMTEVRTFGTRYLPDTLRLGPSGSLLDWMYTLDNIGNPTAITDNHDPANNRTYAFQAHNYFLTQGDGPWGTRSFSYDRIGNRLSETRDGTTDTYLYTTNPGGGNLPLLDEVQLAVGGTRDYTFGPAGHLETIDADANHVQFSYGEDGRLASASRVSGDEVAFAYDARSFLTEASTAGGIFSDGFETGELSCWSGVVGADPGSGPCPPPGAQTRSTYSSDGTLHSLERRVVPAFPGDTQYLFYFNGRPVAQSTVLADGTQLRFEYLTTDHLGTPVLVTDPAGAIVWEGGFEPFGDDWQAGSGDGASENGLALRFPGQWEDGQWSNATLGADLYYNLHRWYEAGIGRYTSRDELPLPGPMDLDSSFMNVFGYAAANPLVLVDPLGLASFHPSNDCKRRWERKIFPRLLTLPQKQGCGDFFCTELGTDLDQLIRGFLPIIVLTENLTGDVRGWNPCGLREVFPYERLPQQEIDRPFFCNRPVKDVLNVLIHELGHWADCQNNDDRFTPGGPPSPKQHRDGCQAEVACLGGSIASNCSTRFFPRRP